jgi:hypothetical protein
MCLLPLARNRSLKYYFAIKRFSAFSSCYHTFIFKKEIIIILTCRPVFGGVLHKNKFLYPYILHLIVKLAWGEINTYL